MQTFGSDANKNPEHEAMCSGLFVMSPFSNRPCNRGCSAAFRQSKPSIDKPIYFKGVDPAVTLTLLRGATFVLKVMAFPR